MMGCLAAVVLYWPSGDASGEVVWMHQCPPWPATECVALRPHRATYLPIRDVDVICIMDGKLSVHETHITRSVGA